MKRKTTSYLRFIITYKTIMGLVELFFGVYIYRVFQRSPERVFATIAEELGFNLNNFFVNFAVEKAELIGADRVYGVISILILFCVLNLIEAWGLHLKRTWAEWLTVFGTGALIPFEIWELILRPAFMTFVILVINSFIVYYLAKHRELFHSRREEKELKHMAD